MSGAALTLKRRPSCVAEYEDASLSSWVNRERFQGYLQIDGFTLYELGETGKQMALYLLSLLSFCFSLGFFTKSQLKARSRSSFPFLVDFDCTVKCNLYI